MNDGGPAFPITCDNAHGKEGLTIRDYFAAHAPDMPDEYYWSKMKVKERYTNAERDEKLQLRIEWRYYYADKMLQQREKK